MSDSEFFSINNETDNSESNVDGNTDTDIENSENADVDIENADVDIENSENADKDIENSENENNSQIDEDKNTSTTENAQNRNLSEEEKKMQPFAPSDLELEKLLSKATVELALQFEKQSVKKNVNALVNHSDEMAISPKLDIKKIVACLDESVPNEKGSVFNQKSEPDQSIKGATDAHNTKFINEKAKLDTTIFSLNSSHHSMFVNEEFNLAEQTMKKAITRKRNLEKQKVAPPLSTHDPRIARKKKITAGKEWFNLPRGKLTTQNKLHFLLVKHRHLLFQKWKPPKQKDQVIPKYFQMGRVIEGPGEYFSARTPRRNRKQSWAKELMSDANTKDWLRLKSERALSRSRRVGNTVWKPAKAFKHNTRYKLRKKILKVRKVTKRVKAAK